MPLRLIIAYALIALMIAGVGALISVGIRKRREHRRIQRGGGSRGR